MNRKGLMVFSLSTLLGIGIAGCGGNNEANVQDGYSNRMQPVGYYSNETPNRGGNALVDNDNDGALTEIMDHTLGEEGQVANDRRTRILETRDENGNPGNPTKPLADYDKNFFERDNRFSKEDANYHGHINQNNHVGRPSYYTNYDGKLADKVRNTVKSVPNVKDAETVIYGKNMVVAVNLKDNRKKKSTINDINGSVKPYVKGKKLTVVTDPSSISRIRSIDNDLRDGGPTDQIQDDLRDLLQSKK
ncbi:YhcN/YlaJ family sporulation lipoprotein [Bacillus massilinigeriensis]|uniref:YhcN/YlaJ family sporulation lipoprotein n=1 Tax=Bacillus massilionigeriensis TaxID=1805475 RepID=UPI000A038CFD|nr:YhcN/YlaJ family sporulation lipoprotein [Bacillus massilionigeriensis]